MLQVCDNVHTILSFFSRFIALNNFFLKIYSCMFLVLLVQSCVVWIYKVGMASVPAGSEAERCTLCPAATCRHNSGNKALIKLLSFLKNRY